jgi:hypothetical protein
VFRLATESESQDPMPIDTDGDDDDGDAECNFAVVYSLKTNVGSSGASPHNTESGVTVTVLGTHVP